MQMRGLSFARTSTVVSRPTPREGDGSPQLKVDVEKKRTSEARVRRAKTLERHERRKYKRAGEIGLEKLIAYRQKQRDCVITETINTLQQELTQVQKQRKSTPSKPARRHTHVKAPTRVPREYKPETLEKRKTIAQLREIKRVFKKVLKFAMRQSKKYGHVFYLAILHLLCSKYQSWVLQNRQEAT